jgi:hypothetical protein
MGTTTCAVSAVDARRARRIIRREMLARGIRVLDRELRARLATAVDRARIENLAALGDVQAQLFVAAVWQPGPWAEWEDCQVCDGLGSIDEECDFCGSVNEQDCDACDGKGRVWREQVA